MNVRITLKVVGDNGVTGDENRSGYALLVDGKEMTRVAFVRRFGASPNKTLKQALDHEVGKAKEAKRIYEEMFSNAGELQ